jgi:hypothetical protein
MQDIHRALGALRRPPLLVRAARLGAGSYDRDAALPRLLGPGPVPAPADALVRLIGIERDHETARRQGAATWRAVHHVAVLIAVMGEAETIQNRSSDISKEAQSIEIDTQDQNQISIANI